MTLAEMMDKLERGRIGHRGAMEWLGVESYNELVEVMYLNGRQMPGHRAHPVSEETMRVLRLVTKPANSG